ncbi:MAG: NAD(P)/FAD-dependent oxidoreductase, partial [Balneolaceae bacterium]
MPQDKFDSDVAIVGGGPVGLYLAGRLLQNDISVTILEQKTSIDQHSKSLGIHPVSMERFEEAEIVDEFLNKGLKIETGVAFLDHLEIGDVSFKSCPKPYNFILALPQFQTEAILENWVTTLNPSTLTRGATVTEINQHTEGVNVQFSKNGKQKKLSCRFLIGCDGKNSFVRKQTNIEIQGRAYPDTYIMGDYSDNTDFGTKAAVYLHKSGLIESFPLPNSHRRWVVKTDEYINKPSRHFLDDLIENRLGHSL